MRTPGGGGGGQRVPRNSSGQPDFPRVYSNPEPTVDRYRGNTNDDQIVKNKSPWMHRGYGIPAGTGAGDFDQKTSGPAPITLRLNTFTYRQEVGDAHRDTTGMHTIMPKDPTRSLGSNKPRVMVQGRTNLLTTVRFRGQTYSETTKEQGT